MEVADRETEPGVGLESAIRSHHHDSRRFERIVLGEYQLPVVEST